MTHPKITIFYIILGEITGRRLRAKNIEENVRHLLMDFWGARFWRTEKESPCPAGKYSYGLTDTYT